jgi:hypothetical protein
MTQNDEDAKLHNLVVIAIALIFTAIGLGGLLIASL